MAYPTGILSFVLEQIDGRIIAIKKQCQGLRADAAAGSVASGRILSLFQYLRAERVALPSLAATPGLAAYAQQQKNNAQLDVVSEFNALMATIDGVTSWISTNFPKDAGGALLERTLGTDGPTEVLFSPSQTAGFRTQLDAVIAAIA